MFAFIHILLYGASVMRIRLDVCHMICRVPPAHWIAHRDYSCHSISFSNVHSFLSSAAAFAPSNPTTSATSTTALQAESGRREFFGALTAAAALAAPVAANAVIDYENIGYLGGSSIVDINNANVRAYLKMPGMYPTVAGKIVSHGPYSGVADLYKIPGLSSAEADVIKKYESRLTAKTPSPDYVIDRINNGL
jgi:DNA uptake protein and related DNA-binding proteins|uniref:Photosystem II 12 kDa extrinsic protein n=1 Tax=Chaetoceros neogracilis TaxID=240364 RepID=A0A679C264_9STRA|nr:extrinsic protein in photosystem II [Chaetoceros gracilis]